MQRGAEPPLLPPRAFGQLGKEAFSCQSTFLTQEGAARQAGAVPGSRTPPPPALTGAGEDVGVFLIGAEQAHELGGPRVVQWEQADVVLGGRGGSAPPASLRGGPQPPPQSRQPPSWALHSSGITALGSPTVTRSGLALNRPPFPRKPKGKPHIPRTRDQTSDSSVNLGGEPHLSDPLLLLQPRPSSKIPLPQAQSSQPNPAPCQTHLDVLSVPLLLPGRCLALVVGGVGAQGTPDREPGDGAGQRCELTWTAVRAHSSCQGFAGSDLPTPRCPENWGLT